MDNADDMAGHLELEVDLPVRGRRKRKPLVFGVVRELRASDIEMLKAAPAAQPSIKRLSDRHHGVARLLASGASVSEAAAMSGYTPMRISMLQSDPAFQELLELYREKKDEVFQDTLLHMAGLSLDIVMELRDRLENDPESLSVEDLRRLLETTADRTGHGPSSKQEVNVNVNLAERLDAARRRALDARKGEIIDAEIVEETKRIA